MTTEKQKKLLNFIASYRRDYSHPPTLREMADGMSLKDTKSIVNMLTSLEKKGLIGKSESRKSRTVFLTEKGYILIGDNPVMDLAKIKDSPSMIAIDLTPRLLENQSVNPVVTNETLQNPYSIFHSEGTT